MEEIMRFTTGLLAPGLALWLAIGGTAFAQVKQPLQQPAQEPSAQMPQPDPNSAPPDKYGKPIDPRPVTKDGSSSAPLSDDLARSQGVVHPTGKVDPGMSQQPPDPGPKSTPVIKPPPAGSGVTPE